MDPNLENPAEHGMNPNLRKAVQQGIDQNSRDATPPGSIDALYALIRGNANALESIDAIPFVQTPLHEAASAGHTQLAMEIMTLKPSFARKLNQDGFTPMHLALQNDETRVALRLLDVDKDLVRIQGRGGLTPLHYAAQIGHLDLLVAFLSVCPESIEDVTIRRETVLHIALTNEKFDAFQLLLGWLRRAWFKDAFSLGRKLLNWQDEEGDTVLHIAISRNQPQASSFHSCFLLKKEHICIDMRGTTKRLEGFKMFSIFFFKYLYNAFKIKFLPPNFFFSKIK